MTENSGDNPIASQLFALGSAFAVPFVQKLAGQPTGKLTTQTVNQDRLAEVADHSRLNGSGPSDPNMMLASAPTSLQGFINGGTTAAVATVSKIPQEIWIFGALGMLLFFIWKNRH